MLFSGQLFKTEIFLDLCILTDFEFKNLALSGCSVWVYVSVSFFSITQKQFVTRTPNLQSKLVSYGDSI